MLPTLMQISGVSLIALSLFHLVLWRMLGWTAQIAKLEPLTARVFAVHTFFVAFVLLGLGLVSVIYVDELCAKSVLARAFLIFVVVFWTARLMVQIFVFDPVLWRGRPWRVWARLAASLAWLGYTSIYAAALHEQFAE